MLLNHKKNEKSNSLLLNGGVLLRLGLEAIKWAKTLKRYQVKLFLMTYSIYIYGTKAITYNFKMIIILT